MSSNSLTASDGSVAIRGNNNNVSQHIVPPIREPKRAFVYEVCKLIVDKNFDENSEYSISENADWTKKIEYNKIEKYKILFEEYSFAREDIEELLNGYENRTKLIRNFKSLYINSVYNFPDANNDFRLDCVFEKLCTTVDESSILSDEIYIEDRNQSIYQLMFYAFTKCQILEIPPRKVD